MSYGLIEATPSAYVYPLLIKSLLHTSLMSATDQQIVYADRALRLLDLSAARWQAGQRADGSWYQARRHRRRAGLGQSSLSRMLLRCSQYGRRVAHGECAAVTGADPLYDQSRRGRHPAGARGLSADAGRHQGSHRAVSEPSSCCPMTAESRQRHWSSPANTRSC